jgi:4-hydroxybenzoate polyprenyltransferase
MAFSLDARGLVLVGVTVMVGQLSIGWSNDWLDAERDLAAGRSTKPAVAGAVSVERLRSAALAALVVSVPLSLASGLDAGAWHLVLVASGWAYNLGLKATSWSPTPYLVGFGALPVYVSVAAGVTPLWWWSASAGLLGVAAHFANAAPDIEADLQHGVRGAPQRLGARSSLFVCFSLLAMVAAVLVLQLPAGRWSFGVGVIAVTPVVVGASLAVRVGATRAVFVAVMLAAVVDVALLVLLA